MNPFPGLRPFETDETHLFFGRDGQVSDIVTRLHRQRLIAVVGTSGSGKSSLVRAGLLPMLEGGFMPAASSFWRFAVTRPRSDAIRELAVALAQPAVLGSDHNSSQRAPAMEAVLRRSSLGLIDSFKQAHLAPHENLLVVVDQFEELFRFQQLATSEQADGGAAFVRLLIEAARQHECPIYIVLTMRSDFLGDCARFRDLPEILNGGQYLIPRLTRDQRRAAIEGPIAVSGATITPRLTQRLLNDAGDDPDALPVMQHALMRTWDAWNEAGSSDRPIDLAHYLAIGEMTHALDRHADQAYNDLALIPGAQVIAESMFRGLSEKRTDYGEVPKAHQARRSVRHCKGRHRNDDTSHRYVSDQAPHVSYARVASALRAGHGHRHLPRIADTAVAEASRVGAARSAFSRTLPAVAADGAALAGERGALAQP